MEKVNFRACSRRKKDPQDHHHCSHIVQHVQRNLTTSYVNSFIDVSTDNVDIEAVNNAASGKVNVTEAPSSSRQFNNNAAASFSKNYHQHHKRLQHHRFQFSDSSSDNDNESTVDSEYEEHNADDDHDDARNGGDNDDDKNDDENSHSHNKISHNNCVGRFSSVVTSVASSLASVSISDSGFAPSPAADKKKLLNLNKSSPDGIGESIIDLRYEKILNNGERPLLRNDEATSKRRLQNASLNLNLDLNSNSDHHDNGKAKLRNNTAMALYELSCNGLLCDAVIFVENAFFTVHSPIMCTCSSYFQATFAGGLNLRDPPKLNLKQQEIFIPHVSGAIMEELVKYAYLRRALITNDNVYEMLVTSDYFGITGMMDRSKEFIIRNLTPQNCVAAMIFANFRLMDDLYSRVRVYVMRYFPQVMIENKDILQLDLEEFYDIISDDNLNTRDEDLVWRMCLKWIENDLNHRRKHIAYLMSGVRLGLMTAKCFMEEVKDHPLVLQCEEAKPLIVEAFKFMYDLDIVNSTSVPLSTPALAMPRLPHEVIFAIGGWSDDTSTDCIETYDTRSDRWIVLQIRESASVPRAYHGSAVIGFKIYCIGGYDGVDCFSKCHVLDLEINKWTEIAPMYCRRCYVSATVLNGCIYAVGGFDGWHRLNSCERYDPTTNQWTKVAPLLANRSDAGCCTLNGKIYVVGGFNGQECLDSAEAYDPELNQWKKIPLMSQRRSGVSCVAFRGCVYVVGGFNGTARLMCAERYDPHVGHWASICDMSHPRSNFGLEIIDDMIFAVGGFDGISTISHTECYVPETNEWMEATNMNYARSALTVNNVGGLPKRLNYMYKERHRLVEERKQRLIANTIRRAVQVTITRQIVMNQSMNGNSSGGSGIGINNLSDTRQYQPQQYQIRNQTQQNRENIAAGQHYNPNHHHHHYQQQHPHHDLFMNPSAQQESVASAAAAPLIDPSIFASAQHSQDEEVRDIAASLFQQNHRINFQLQDDILYSDRYFSH